MIKKIIQNLLHKELSYQIHGAAIEVRKDFGPGHKEKLYQKAFEEELRRRKISFEKEKAIKIYSPKDGKYIGLYRPDFIIDEKIIIEIKAEKFVNREEIKRIYDYLRNSKYELAYFINFASPKLFVKRIILTNDRKPIFRNLLVAISLLLVFFSGLYKAQAAEISLDSKTKEIGVGEQFEASVFLNTEEEYINAVEGKVIFQEDLLELKEIRDGATIVNFWIERPSANTRKATNIETNNHEIMFSGITPGGFNGERGLLFSIIFQAKQEGRGIIEIQDERALLNDGLGTQTKITTKKLEFVVIRDGIRDDSWSVPKDAEPPEPFEPIVASDPTIFDGKYFLVFATQDKGTGIAGYAIHESRRIKTRIDMKKWQEAESPYVLKDQKLRSYIYMKAIDKAGNERIVSLPPKYPLKWYERYEIWVIIIIGLAVVSYIMKKIWRKKIIH